MSQGTYLKIMEIGERGSSFCPNISENFSTLDIHNHDGINSAAINAKAISKASQTLLSSSWIDTGSDFKQLVTLPSGYSFDTATIKAIIFSGVNVGAEFIPTIVKVSPTTFDLHCLYGDVDVKVVIS